MLKVATCPKVFFIKKNLAHSWYFRNYFQVANGNNVYILHVDTLFTVKGMLFFTHKMLKYILHRYNLGFVAGSAYEAKRFLTSFFKTLNWLSVLVLFHSSMNLLICHLRRHEVLVQKRAAMQSDPPSSVISLCLMRYCCELLMKYDATEPCPVCNFCRRPYRSHLSSGNINYRSICPFISK